MNINKKRLSIILGSLFLLANRAYAVRITNPLGEGTDIPEVIGKITTALIALCGPIVGVLVLVGGFQIMFSGGNEEKVKEGRHTITYAMIGFAIILMAKAISIAVIQLVGGNP